MQIIDSHQHFWRLSRNDYTWLTPQLKPIYRDFLPADLQPYLDKLNITGTILVQAAPTIAETEFLLALAQEYSFIRGVVGWVELNAEDVTEKITTLTQNPLFCGIRPMLQDIADVNWILHDEMKPGLKHIEQLKLTFDALILPKHLLVINELANRYPNLKIVIDHAAKPNIKSVEFEPWASEILMVAKHKNVYCKLSGLLNEAQANATLSDLKAYIDHIFVCFGSERIMWGSDYPVLNLVSDYVSWFTMCQSYVSALGEKAMTNVFGSVALNFYNR